MTSLETVCSLRAASSWTSMTKLTPWHFAIELANHANELYDSTVTERHIIFLTRRSPHAETKRFDGVGAKDRAQFDEHFANNEHLISVQKNNNGTCTIFVRGNCGSKWPQVRKTIHIAHEFAVASTPRQYAKLIRQQGDTNGLDI